jgi:hypothetical protein
MRAVGVAWYSPQAWKRLAAIPEARIEKSYADYLRAKENSERELAAFGLKTEIMQINIDHMTAWCHRNGYEIDSKGRIVYGTMLVAWRDDPTVFDMPVVETNQ